MDKRRHKRYTRRCETEFSANGVSGRGIASNFSLQGLFIRTNHPLAPETAVDIVLHLPDGSNSRLQGKVRRAAKTRIGRVMKTPTRAVKNGMGIEITGRDVNYLHFIRSLLSTKHPAPPKAG
ncbi:MAG: hypothetical protein Kow0025_01110 [Thermodesulfovibrionales bacterium]